MVKLLHVHSPPPLALLDSYSLPLLGLTFANGCKTFEVLHLCLENKTEEV